MSQQGANLSQDVEGSLPGGAGSEGTAGSGSSSAKQAVEIISSGWKPASPVINLPQEVQGTHVGDASPGEATPEAVVLAGTAGFNSSFSSVKLAAEDGGGGSKPASPLEVQAGDKTAGSKLPSPVVGLVAHAGEPARPAAVVGAGGSDKGKEKDEPAAEEGAGDIAGSSSKSIKSSSDGDVQGDAKDAPAPAAGGDGSGKRKGKGVAAEADHALHMWTERDRRKKMRTLYSTLHSFLPRLPEKADKATIVKEAADYIKTLEGTVHMLEKLKLERLKVAQLLGAGSKSSRRAAAPPPPMRHGGGAAPAPAPANMGTISWNVPQATAAPPPPPPPQVRPLQTWSLPNITVSVAGNEAFFALSAPRQQAAVSKALFVLDKFCIDVLTLHVSSDQTRCSLTIHTCLNAAAGNVALELMTAETRYELAASELARWINNAQ